MCIKKKIKIVIRNGEVIGNNAGKGKQWFNNYCATNKQTLKRILLSNDRAQIFVNSTFNHFDVVSIHNFSFNIISTNKFSPPDVPLGTLSKRLPTRIRTLKIAKVCIILTHTPRKKSSQVYTRNRIYAMEELAHELAQVTRRSICIYVVSPLESWWPSCALTVVDSLSIFPKRLDQTTPLGTPPLPTYALTQAQPSMHAPGE